MVEGKHLSGASGRVRSGAQRTLRALAGAAVLIVGGLALAAALGPNDTTGTVVRVIDGDTLIAEVAGEETTIRLLNIDTPETKDPYQPVQCLGPEASEFLAERLPEGTQITLEYDEEKVDRYDRTLAGVYESGSLINAEIAAAGLGVPVLFEPNDRFLPEVEQAWQTAEQNQLGLLAPEVACTLPAQMQTLEAAVAEVPTAVEGDPAAALAQAQTALEDVEALQGALGAEGLPGLGNAVLAAPLVSPTLEGLQEDARVLREDAASAHDTLSTAKTAYDEEQERLERERREQEERERREQEERERKEQEEQERRRAEEREQERRDQDAPAPAPAPKQQQAPTPQRPAESEPEPPRKKKPAQDSSTGGSNSGQGAPRKDQQPVPEPPPAQKPVPKSSGCTPYGPEIPYSADGGYTGKRYGMPGGKTFRKCR